MSPRLIAILISEPLAPVACWRRRSSPDVDGFIEIDDRPNPGSSIITLSKGGTGFGCMAADRRRGAGPTAGAALTIAADPLNSGQAACREACREAVLLVNANA